MEKAELGRRRQSKSAAGESPLFFFFEGAPTGLMFDVTAIVVGGASKRFGLREESLSSSRQRSRLVDTIMPNAHFEGFHERCSGTTSTRSTLKINMRRRRPLFEVDFLGDASILESAKRLGRRKRGEVGGISARKKLRALKILRA